MYRKYSEFNIDIKKENKGRIVPVPWLKKFPKKRETLFFFLQKIGWIWLEKQKGFAIKLQCCLKSRRGTATSCWRNCLTVYSMLYKFVFRCGFDLETATFCWWKITFYPLVMPGVGFFFGLFGEKEVGCLMIR